MEIKEIRQLFFAKEWRAIVANFTDSELCELLTFEEAVQLSYALFHKNMFDDAIQLYALNLAKMIKQRFKAECDGGRALRRGRGLQPRQHQPRRQPARLA